MALSVEKIKPIVDNIPCPSCPAQPVSPCIKTAGAEMIWGFHTERVVIALAEEVFTLKAKVSLLDPLVEMPEGDVGEKPASEESEPKF